MYVYTIYYSVCVYGCVSYPITNTWYSVNLYNDAKQRGWGSIECYWEKVKANSNKNSSVSSKTKNNQVYV